MKTKKHISIVFLISICFLFKNTAFAQASSKNAPLFLLQGAVKQKGKPIEGVELLLLKDGKSVAKIITPKNGLYYFQLNKSSTDTQSEYVLKINKSGSVSGVLKINTYIPKDQFTTIPYLFYLDITFNPESTAKKDFGQINWFVEKNEFNFDENYVPVPEKDTVVLDSVIATKASLIKDSSTSLNSFVQNSKAQNSLIAINSTNSEVLNSTFIKNANSKSSTSSTNSKSLVKTTDNVTNNTALKNNTSSSAPKNQQVPEKKGVNSNQQNKISNVSSKNNFPPNNSNNTSTAITMSKRDSLAANSSIQKDLFFLTGVPMGQFKTNLPSINQGGKKTEVFDPNEVFSTNSERSHLLSEKQRFERKKAENFAKKHETNNTLTSLLNEVDVFDKKNK